MTTHSFNLQSLKQSRNEMAKQLESNPLFQAIQLVDKAIATLEQPIPSPETQSIHVHQRKTPAQNDAVADAIVRHFQWTKNTSIKLTDLIEVLRRQNLGLPPSQHGAIASVGALLGKRKEVFEKLATGQWQLKEEYYRTSPRDSEPRVA